MARDTPIMVVDDDANQRNLIAGYLRQAGHAVISAASGEEALEILQKQSVVLVISDVRMPGISGLELLHRIRRQHALLPVLMVTAYADVRTAVDAMQGGALNYLEKPIDLDELNDFVSQILDSKASQRQSADDLQLEPEFKLPEKLVAASPVMHDVIREAALVAPFDTRVLLSGESGTGKEVIAQLVHDWSTRKENLLIKVNCAALPEQLLESELFGYEKGAFTGATGSRIGRFEEACGGTIFLDEIAEMPSSLQAKLLRVLHDGIFQRLGSNRDIKTDARLIAATNRDLEKEVHEGRFREDLFYRLNVIEIHLPPLRERRADVLPMASKFANLYSQGRARLSPAVVAGLNFYDWPGNVRELQNAMERAVLMARGGIIMPEHMPRRIQQALTLKPHNAIRQGGVLLQDVEDQLIIQTLRDNTFNRTETARALGISRRALIYKLRRLEEAGHDIKPGTTV